MTQITINRELSTNEGTEGILTARFQDSKLTLRTIECPWKKNKVNYSCIPAGNYICRIVISPRFGRRYEIYDVPKRTHILFHPGNRAGDREIGFESDSRGCILLGMDCGTLGGQKAVLNSRHALGAFEAFCAGRDFQLEINELSPPPGDIL